MKCYGNHSAALPRACNQGDKRRAASSVADDLFSNAISAGGDLGENRLRGTADARL